MRLRGDKSEHDLAALRERYAASIGERDEAAAAVERSREATDRASAELAARLGLGEIDVAEYEREKARAQEQLTQAEAMLARAESVQRAVGTKAADLAQRLAEERVAESERLRNGIGAELDAARAQVERLESALAGAEEALVLVQHDAYEARDGLDPDPERKRRAGTRSSQQAETITWWARERGAYPEEWPVALRARVARAVEARKRQAERENAALREASRRSLQAAGMSASEIERTTPRG